VMRGGAFAIVDARLPLFWRRTVAQQFNENKLGGAGRVVRVEIHEKEFRDVR